ncbi:MAG: ATP-binding cassette domain-containing protein [Bdellovibrionales bacterium]
MKSLKNTLVSNARFLGRRNTAALSLSVALGLFWFLIEISFVFVIQTFLSALKLVDPSSSILNNWFSPSVSSATILLILFAFVRGAIWATRQYYCVALAQNFVTEKRTFLLENSLKNSALVPNHFLLRTFSESTLQSGSFLQHFVLSCVVSLTIFLFSSYALFIAPKEFLTSLMFLGLFAFYLRKYDKRLSELAKKIDHEKSVSTQVVVDGIRNNFFIKISGRINDEIRKGKVSLNNFDRHFKNYYMITAIRSALPMFLGGAVIAVTFFMSLNYYGTKTSDLLLFFYILIRLTQSVTELSNYLTEVHLHLPGFRLLKDACERFKTLSARYPYSTALNDSKAADFPTLTSIIAENLSFSYDSKTPILSGINFSLKKGESLLIKGASGKGKSTLLALIVGLLQPSRGKMLINNQNSSEIFSNISNKTGYVGPDSYFISGTLKENLLYGHPNPSSVTADQIWAKLKAVNLLKEVKEIPKQLDYQINSDVPFSTGQKQRLSMARALLRNPDLLLLDESTANLDAETEAEVIQHLRSVAHNYIVIIVSHKAGFDAFATHRINL